MELLEKYFPELLADPVKKEQFAKLEGLYREWNEKINVISRKDMDGLYEKHVLHSLAIYYYHPFPAGTSILDIGTGGGFPGIPLAIAHPECEFHLVDSIGKKINVVRAVREGLGLKNVRATHIRAEQLKESFDYIVSRAVAPLKELVGWSHKQLKITGKQGVPGKFLLLKGGDLSSEIEEFIELFPSYSVKEIPLSTYFSEEFFDTKKIIELIPVGKKRG